MSEVMITITKAEYDRLVAVDTWMSYLEAAGIDNSPAWDEAMEAARRDEEAADAEEQERKDEEAKADSQFGVGA